METGVPPAMLIDGARDPLRGLRPVVTETHRLVRASTPIAAKRNDALALDRESSAPAPTYQQQARLRRACWAFATRRVPPAAACSILRAASVPQAGDLVLARVDVLGHHCNLQLANGRRRCLFEGDEIVVAYANRYASSQFEALVPKTLGPCHLVAGGGIAARAVSWHEQIARGPTHITPIGLLADCAGRRINLRDYALRPVHTIPDPALATVAVVGTAMDAGKTQTAAFLVRGLRAAGLRAAYAKVTGTGAGGDTWLLKDAGAYPVLDFTDAGMASTYLASPEEVAGVLLTLIGHIAREDVDAVVLEIADGVYQRETAALLRSTTFARLVGGIVLAARDSMGAAAGVNWLRNQSTPVLALSGVLSASPLQSREASAATNLPVYSRADIADPSTAMAIAGRVQRFMMDHQSEQQTDHARERLTAV